MNNPTITPLPLHPRHVDRCHGLPGPRVSLPEHLSDFNDPHQTRKLVPAVRTGNGSPSVELTDKPRDLYFDVDSGDFWVFRETSSGELSWHRASEEIRRTLEGKQDRLTAGANITIDEDGTISSTGSAVGPEGIVISDVTGLSDELERLSNGKLDKTGKAADSAQLGGFDADQYAKKADLNEVTAEQVGAYTKGEVNEILVRLADTISEAKSEAESAQGDAQLAKSIAEGAADSAGNAEIVAYEAKDAAEAAQSTLANKVTNYGNGREIRFLDGPDGGNVVFALENGSVNLMSFSSIGDGESIVFSWYEDGEGKVLYAKDIATKDALATNVPKRVKNDDDTEHIDGSGNVYALEVPKSMYFIVDKGWGGGTDLQEWTLYSSGNGVWKWSNNGAYSSNSYYITYDASAGTLSAYYESGGYSRTITIEKNLDPTAEGVDFGSLGGLTVAQYSCSYVPKTNQRSEPSEPTDRLARKSQLAEYALKTDVPKRVRNDGNTEVSDGSGNVYPVSMTPSYFEDNYARRILDYYGPYQNGYAWSMRGYRGSYMTRYYPQSGLLRTHEGREFQLSPNLDPAVDDFSTGDPNMIFHPAEATPSTMPSAKFLRGTTDGKFTDAQKEELADTFAKKGDLGGKVLDIANTYFEIKSGTYVEFTLECTDAAGTWGHGPHISLTADGMLTSDIYYFLEFPITEDQIPVPGTTSVIVPHLAFIATDHVTAKDSEMLGGVHYQAYQRRYTVPDRLITSDTNNWWGENIIGIRDGEVASVVLDSANETSGGGFMFRLLGHAGVPEVFNGCRVFDSIVNISVPSEGSASSPSSLSVTFMNGGLDGSPRIIYAEGSVTEFEPGCNYLMSLSSVVRDFSHDYYLTYCILCRIEKIS